HRPYVLQDPERHRVRQELAQREVPEQPRARALPDPDRSGREDPLEELQEHREAGGERGHAEEVISRTALRYAIPARASRRREYAACWCTREYGCCAGCRARFR